MSTALGGELLAALEAGADRWLLLVGWLVVASTVVFLAVGALNRLLPRHAAGLRHALLALVLVRLVLPPTLTSRLSIWNLLDGYLFGGHLFGDLVATEGTLASQGAGSASFHEALHAAVTAPNGTATGPWANVLFGLWTLGVALTAVSLIARRWRYRRLIAGGRVVTAGPARAAVGHWCQRFGLLRKVRLVTSSAPVVPFTLGTLRPAIFLPEKVLASADHTLIEAVVAHELAHVKRWDDLWLALQHLAQSLFFFHPVVWLTVRAMGIEREIACDRLVLASGTLSAKLYGQSLLRVLGLQLKPTAVALAAGSQRKLTMRIQQIANNRAAARPRALLSLFLVAALGWVLLPMAATGEPPKVVDVPPSGSVVVADAGTAARLSLMPAVVAQALQPSLDDLMPGAKVTSGFGMRRHPVDGNLIHHDGIDLSTGKESAVYAPRGGVVEVAQENYGPQGKFGTVVIVDHGGGVKTFYAHLARLSVRAGEGITDGDEIGLAGNSGVSFGPHLHFEIWKDGEKVDPARIGEVVGGC